MKHAFGTVTVTSAGTAVQFSTSVQPWRAVVVRARPKNGSCVYVGGSAVTSTAGVQFDKGDSFVFSVVKPEDPGVTLSSFYLEADINNDRLDYWAHN